MTGVGHEAVNKFMKADLATDRFAGCMFTFPNKRHYLIWTREKRDLSSLVHECVHAANRILYDVGVSADFINDEAQAYLVEFLLQKSGVKL